MMMMNGSGRNLDHPAVGTLQEGYFPIQLEYNNTAGGLVVHHKAGPNDGGHGVRMKHDDMMIE